MSSAEALPPFEAGYGRVSPFAVDPLASHIATMIRTLDAEVIRIRDGAEEEAEHLVAEAREEAQRLVADAHAEAERTARDADERVAEAKRQRDAALVHRARIVAELRTLRETIVRAVTTLDVSPDAPADDRRAARRGAAPLPPPPARQAHDEDQTTLWSTNPAADAT